MDTDKSKNSDISPIQLSWTTSMTTTLQRLNEPECDINRNDNENNDISNNAISSALIKHGYNAFNSSARKSATLESDQDIALFKKFQQTQLKTVQQSMETLDIERVNITNQELSNCNGNNDNGTSIIKLSCDNNTINIQLTSHEEQLVAEIVKPCDAQTLQCNNSLDMSTLYYFDWDNPMEILSKIFSSKQFDPIIQEQKLLQAFTGKRAVCLTELTNRGDDKINKQMHEDLIKQFERIVQDDNICFDPLVDNIITLHATNEFSIYCLCQSCKQQHELILRLMTDHFRASHMVVTLLDGLIKAYGSMLKNTTAYNKFENLLNTNKKICWISTSFYHFHLSEYLDFIDYSFYSDQIIIVLFSSILMLNNPMLLLQILAFHIECIVKAFVEGFVEITAPNQVTIAVKKLNYILDGYDEMMHITDQIASSIFTFENIFLRKFHLTWKLLCQRLYQQYVYASLTDTMLACVVTLKDLELTFNNAALIQRYIHFDDIMNNVENLWSTVWCELNKYILSDVEFKRRKYSMEIFQIFNAIQQDAMAINLPDDSYIKDKDMCNLQKSTNHRLVWHRIMICAKTKWPKPFFEAPNTLIVDSKCTKCNALLEYHTKTCKCITCCIGGCPLPPKTKELIGLCNKCSTLTLREKKMMHTCESEILNTCTKDDFLNIIKNTNIESLNHVIKRNKDRMSHLIDIETIKEKNNTEEVESSPNKSIKRNRFCKMRKSNGNDLIRVEHFPISLAASLESVLRHNYHISWAIFPHLNNRKKYPHKTIEESYFCHDCPQPACQLAIKILNDEISLGLTMELLKHYQPIITTRNELRALLPKILFYHHKIMKVSANIHCHNINANDNNCRAYENDGNKDANDDVINAHDYIIKIFWIFVMSVYATYFIKDENDSPISINLQYLELYNDDIRIKVDALRGNENDTKFSEFLSKIKSLSPKNLKECNKLDTVNIDSKLNELLNMSHVTETFRSDLENHLPSYDMVVSNTSNANRKDIELSEIHECTTAPLCHKNIYKELTKKCCFEHKDMNEFCNKKRLKKDCNHGRVSETRERLRKKLSQIIHTRENVYLEKPHVVSSAATATGAASDSCSPTLIKKQQQYEMPENFETTGVDKSKKATYLEDGASTGIKKNKSTTMNFNVKSPFICHCNSNTNNTNNNVDCTNSSCEHLDEHRSNIPNCNSSNVINNTIKNKGQQQQRHREIDNNNEEPMKKEGEKENSVKNIHLGKTEINSIKQKQVNTNKNKLITNAHNDIRVTSLKSSNTLNNRNRKNLNIINDTSDTIDKYSDEPINEKKWIKETLSYIEGSKKYPTYLGSSNNNNINNKNTKMQPQTKDPKKAAKKAKQKQRKEEEKRIIELKQLRSQFENIYFKEFTEKHLLKNLKANKKQQQRDKKRIALLEANIKNLQRAKAKVEVNILELIATVKQTNTEFKFSYLPTKEQQLEKLKELQLKNGINDETILIPIKNNNNNNNNINNNNNNNRCSTNEYCTKNIPTVEAHSLGRIDYRDIGDDAGSIPQDDLHHKGYAIPYAQANRFPLQLNALASAAQTQSQGSSSISMLTPTPDHHAFVTAPYNLMRSTSVCYSPPQNQQLPPNVMATMTTRIMDNPSPSIFNNHNHNNISNNDSTVNNSNNNIDPSKRIVTIKRVNLPNVSEPQVTVTARGSSPDKDKLLYTFINGQLIPTENVKDGELLSPSFKQESIINKTTTKVEPFYSNGKQSGTKISTVFQESSEVLSQKSLNNLSKSQMKKERRRLAKLMKNSCSNPSIHYSAQNISKSEQHNTTTKEKPNEQNLRAEDKKQIKNASLKTRHHISDHNETTNFCSRDINHHDCCKFTLNESPLNLPLSTIDDALHDDDVKTRKTSGTQKQQSIQQHNKKSLRKKRKGSMTMAASIITNNSDDSESTMELHKETYNSNPQKQKQHKQNQKQKLQEKCKSVPKGQPGINAISKAKMMTNPPVKAATTATSRVSQQQNRSNSSTTTCSAATSSSLSRNSISSQINTRENSASSLKLIKVKQQSGNNSIVFNKQNQKQTKNSTKKLLKNEQNQKKTEKLNDNKKQQKQQKRQLQQQSQTLLNKCNKLNVNTAEYLGTCKEEHKLSKRHNVNKKLENKEADNVNKSKKTVSISSPLIENELFDNNPYKSLHMQESASDTEQAILTVNEYDRENEHAKIQKQQKQQHQKNNKTVRNNKMDESKSHLDISINVLQQKLSNNKKCINNEKIQLDKHTIKQQQHNQEVIVTKSLSLEKKQQSKQQYEEPSNEPICGKHKNKKKKKKTAEIKHNYNNNCIDSSKNGCQQLNNATTKGNTTIDIDKKLQCNNANIQKLMISNCDSMECNINSNELTKYNKGQRNKKSKQKSSEWNQTDQYINNVCENINSMHLNNIKGTPTPDQLSSSKIPDTTYGQFGNIWNTEPSGMSIYNNNDNNICCTKSSVTSNISIMDQLNRGVQVENLALPPGITLTKVDPIKSEQLRQKAESIKKLAMPLHQQLQQPMQAYHHHHHSGTTIIAPPVAPITSYFGVPYGGGVDGVASTIDPQSGIIMVEANRSSASPNVPVQMPLATSTSPLTESTSSCNGTKQSKNKKRRNKSKASIKANNTGAPNELNNSCETKMITLRNPMFHKAASSADGIAKAVPATTILHQPSVSSTGRTFENYQSPLDQPAAIIKNDNGMYTIRNPALHQAVTNGLTLGGYCQFGNINYFTPQETVTTTNTATTTSTNKIMQQEVPQIKAQYKPYQKGKQQNVGYPSTPINNPTDNTESFSYFSNDTKFSNNTSPVNGVPIIDASFRCNSAVYGNKIALGCANIVEKHTNNSYNDTEKMNGHEYQSSQVRGVQQHKCLSAIGSEMKNAQQQKHRISNANSQIWSLRTFDQSKNANSTIPTSSSSTIDPIVNDTLHSEDITLQQKYRQSKYFNGFNECISHNGTSLYNHSCGDDSPPPSMTNYTSTYLDGIPNTGIIRYDNVSFLKNLIPGQNLNNEVSIHSADNSQFGNNDSNISGTSQHCLEIRPVYGLQKKSTPSDGTQSLKLINTQPARSSTAYLDGVPLNYYHTDTTNINNRISGIVGTGNQNEITNNKLPISTKYAEYQSTNTAYMQSINPPDNHCSILNLNSILNNKEEQGQGSSVCLNDNLVKNMNNLRISITPSSDEQTTEINSDKIPISNPTITTNVANGDENLDDNKCSWW